MQKKNIKKQIEQYIFQKKILTNDVAIKFLEKEKMVPSYRVPKTFLREYAHIIPSAGLKFPLNFSFFNEKTTLKSNLRKIKPNISILNNYLVKRNNKFLFTSNDIIAKFFLSTSKLALLDSNKQ